MNYKIVFSLFCLALLAQVQAQQLANTALTGNIIGTFSTSLAQCSYYCQNQYVAGCIAWTFDSNSLVCQFFSSVTSNGTSSTQTSGFVTAASTTTTATTTTASTTTAASGTLSNTQYTGTVIGTYSATQAQCSYWCQAQYVAGCVAYSFNSNNSTCQFFSAVTGSTSVTGIVSGQITTSTTTATTTTTTTTTASTTTAASGTLSNTQYTGTVIGTYNSTQAQCSYWCQAQYVAGCVAYSFNTNTNVCQFFSAVTGTTSSTGVVSGQVTTTASSTTATTTTTTSTATTTTTTGTTVATSTKSYICVTGNGVNYPVNDFLQVAAASAGDCCNKCGANVQCFAFAFQATSSTCFLKTATPAPGTTPVNDTSITFGNLVSAH